MAALESQLAALKSSLKVAEGLVESLQGAPADLAGVKVPKDRVDYHEATEPNKTCGKCVRFNRNANSCDVVAGRIEPEYVSNLFVSGVHVTKQVMPGSSDGR